LTIFKIILQLTIPKLLKEIKIMTTNTQELILPTSAKDIEKLKNAIAECIVQHQKMDDCRLQLKAIFDYVKEDLGIAPKYTRKLAKTAYKDSFDDELAENEEFVQLYELLESSSMLENTIKINAPAINTIEHNSED
jgi:hypothetical protein